MRLIHMTCGSVPDIGRCINDFGAEIDLDFTGKNGNFGSDVQVSIHYLDGFSDPDFFEHVWGEHEIQPSEDTAHDA